MTFEKGKEAFGKKVLFHLYYRDLLLHLQKRLLGFMVFYGNIDFVIDFVIDF